MNKTLIWMDESVDPILEMTDSFMCVNDSFTNHTDSLFTWITRLG